MTNTANMANINNAVIQKITRKTYSFEEREILVNLINKYSSGALKAPEEEKSADGTSKRKSMWTILTEEYNALVGEENARSSVQLRRCWENMKANKKNRDDKGKTPQRSPPQALATENISGPPSSGFPPNVLFQPKDSEPYAFEEIPAAAIALQNLAGSKDDTEGLEDSLMTVKKELDSYHRDEEIVTDGESPAKKSKLDPPVPKTKSNSSKSKKKKQNEIDLYEYAVSEAQLKLDRAAIMKQEARVKLEEAEYLREEARLRMIFFTYKLKKLNEDSIEEIMSDN